VPVQPARPEGDSTVQVLETSAAANQLLSPSDWHLRRSAYVIMEPIDQSVLDEIRGGDDAARCAQIRSTPAGKASTDDWAFAFARCPEFPKQPKGEDLVRMKIRHPDAY